MLIRIMRILDSIVTRISTEKGLKTGHYTLSRFDLRLLIFLLIPAGFIAIASEGLGQISLLMLPVAGVEWCWGRYEKLCRETLLLVMSDRLFSDGRD